MLIGAYLNPRFEKDTEIWFGLDRQKSRALAETFPASIVGISA